MVSWLLTDKNTTQKRMQVWKKLKISIEPAINEMLASEEDRSVTDKNPEILLMGVFSPLRVLTFPVFGGRGVALTSALCSLLQYINYSCFWGKIHCLLVFRMKSYRSAFVKKLSKSKSMSKGLQRFPKMHIKLKRTSYSSYTPVYTSSAPEKNKINIHILDSNTHKMFRGISHLNLYILCIKKGKIK